VRIDQEAALVRPPLRHDVVVTRPVDGWAELPGGVLTATSSLYVTQSVALPVGEDSCLLVDPGVTSEEVRTLFAGLHERGLRVVAVVHTHAHWDHLLWPHESVPPVPRWASGRCLQEVERNAAALHAQAVAAIGADGAAELLATTGSILPLPDDGTVPDIAELLVVTHDAHSPGHLAVLHQPSATLCAGDMLSDVELPLAYAEGSSAWDVDGYLAGVDAMEPFIRRAAFVVPGHGHPGRDVTARAQGDRNYLSAVRRGSGSDDPRLADPANRAVDAELRRYLSAAR
jgi:glyoxylase-like metal-dependent hydrolase (beta-lactamase superfamily II)